MKPAILTSPSDTQVEVVRSFDAPVSAVWNSFTKEDLVRQWMLGPPGWSMPVCEMDFRVGGKYENVFRNEAGGLEIIIVGDFREIETHSKIVQDEKHMIGNSGDDAHQETVITITFQETDKTTTVTTLIEYASTKARDDALVTGMEVAMEMGYCRIDEQLDG